MKQITEDYCSFETAKLLKEKGFSENTICRYANVGGITEKWYDDYRERVLRFDWEEGYLIEPLKEPKDQYEIIGDTIPAPTQSLALKWLREVHKIIISFNASFVNSIEPHFSWNIRINSLKSLNDEEHFEPIYINAKSESFEESCEKALLYILKNLI